MNSKDDDMFDYDEYEQIYKCVACDNDAWRIKVDGTVVCTYCTDEYDIEGFLAPPD